MEANVSPVASLTKDGPGLRRSSENTVAHLKAD